MNDKEKSVTIEEAEARITDLTSTIEEKTASSARLNTEIKNLEAEIAKNQAALDKATAIRQKELAEFNAEEKDMLQSIGALKSAVTVLNKHNSFAQVPSEDMLNIAAMLQWQFHKHRDMLVEMVTPAQHKAIAAFVQAPGDYFDADPTFKQSYAPQSGQIFGILKQMKETFESNLSASQKEEMQNQAAYEDLKAAKEAEIKAGEDQKDTKTQELADTRNSLSADQKDTKTQELADTDQTLAQTKQDLEDTRNSLSADQKFLMNLKETCQMTDSEWEERQKARQEEIQACSEALAILTSDDAHDTFTKTFNFAQIKVSKTGKTRRADAAKVLMEAARVSHNPQLAALAARVRLDAFTKVKAAIDDMIAALIKEKADEIKHKDFCTGGLNDNARAQELKARDIDDLEAEIETLTSTIDELTKSIATLEAEIAEMQTQLKRAGEDRELQNKDFQATVADQRETQKLLNSALNVLKAVYEKKCSGGVMGMLEQIIAGTKSLEAEALKAESDA